MCVISMINSKWVEPCISLGGGGGPLFNPHHICVSRPALINTSCFDSIDAGCVHMYPTFICIEMFRDSPISLLLSPPHTHFLFPYRGDDLQAHPNLQPHQTGCHHQGTDRDHIWSSCSRLVPSFWNPSTHRDLVAIALAKLKVFYRLI